MTKAKEVDFIAPQRTHAENMKLGRAEYFCDYTDGTFNTGYRRADAAKKPPITMCFANPAGKKMGVVKPGS